jgi:hypothetical protein
LHKCVHDVLEYHPVTDPAAVTTQRVGRVELRRFTAAGRGEQGVELDPDRLE